MKMSLYKVFNYNVEIQYKSYLLSKAMLFTVVTTLLTILLPLFVAHRSRGFWIRSQYFYEQPAVQFTYEYLLVMETEDPSDPIVCGQVAGSDDDDSEICAQIQILEHDYDMNGKNDILDFKIILNVPPGKTITSVVLIIGLDFKLNTICPLHMQSMGIVSEEFFAPTSEMNFYGDLKLFQTKHLPCSWNDINARYNYSLFNQHKDDTKSILNSIMDSYYNREVITQANKIYSRNVKGLLDTMNLKFKFRVPEVKINYVPSVLQELKWAWVQYFSLVIIFQWVFNRIKKFVFHNRLVMAWEVVPWKKR